MQIDTQRRLHEQLEVQRHLQLRIEAQSKYLQSVLEKAQETLGRQNLGTIALEAAKVELTDLVSQVSTQCLNSAISGTKELSVLCLEQTQMKQTDESIDRCLTSNEGFMRERGLYINQMGKNSSNLSKSIGLQGGKWNSSSNYSERCKGTGTEVIIFDQDTHRYDSIKLEKQKTSPKFQPPHISTKLDLNTDDENDASSSCKQLDLNGFS